MVNGNDKSNPNNPPSSSKRFVQIVIRFKIFEMEQWTIPLLDKLLNSGNQLAQLKRAS